MTDDALAFTRRQFLHTGLVVVSTASTIPTFLHHSGAALAAEVEGSAVQSRPGSVDDRILVVVQLSGGNDGLNTVVPYGAREYYNARPTIAIPESDVIKLDAAKGIGLHPEMRALAEMIQQRQAGVVMGVGYPNPNRSHFASMDIWHTGDTLGGRGLGWIGKAMDQRSSAAAGGLDTICIGAENPLAAQGKKSKPVAFQNVNLFRWVGSDLHPLLGQRYDALNRAGVVPDTTSPEAAFVMRTALDAQLASDRIRAAVAQGTLTSFPGGQLGHQLRMVSSMIRAGLPTRVYYVALGGFDTHANQPGRQAGLLREFTSSVRAFYQELKAQGQEKRVLTMAFSEFGRRVAQNASNGTDHGAAAPVFLFGDMVQPGLLGEHPSLADQKLDNGDLAHGLDFRCLYAAILERWMKLDSKAVLGGPFRPAAVLNTKMLA